MAIAYSFHPEKNYLLVTASGFDESLEDTIGYGMAVLEACLEHQCTRVLCDERDLEYRLSTIDTFQLAEAAVQAAPKLVRIAIATGPDNLEDASFYETVAKNRGLSVKVFQELVEARDWVRGE